MHAGAHTMGAIGAEEDEIVLAAPGGLGAGSHADLDDDLFTMNDRRVFLGFDTGFAFGRSSSHEQSRNDSFVTGGGGGHGGGGHHHLGMGVVAPATLLHMPATTTPVHPPAPTTSSLPPPSLAPSSLPMRPPPLSASRLLSGGSAAFEVDDDEEGDGEDVGKPRHPEDTVAAVVGEVMTPLAQAPQGGGGYLGPDLLLDPTYLDNTLPFQMLAQGGAPGLSAAPTTTSQMLSVSSLYVSTPPGHLHPPTPPPTATAVFQQAHHLPPMVAGAGAGAIAPPRSHAHTHHLGAIGHYPAVSVAPPATVVLADGPPPIPAEAMLMWPTAAPSVVSVATSSPTIVTSSLLPHASNASAASRQHYSTVDLLNAGAHRSAPDSAAWPPASYDPRA
jgi:hypothetical protein